MPGRLELPPPPVARPFDVVMTPPGSKSLTNRALLLAALASGTSRINGPLVDADDAQRMIHALRVLGAAFEQAPGGELLVTGVNGRWRVPAGGVTLDLNNAGTATRFLAAAALLSGGPVTIDGNERMRERPIGELGAALESLGATIRYGGLPGCPPMTVIPPADRSAIGNDVAFPTTQSSQFISALALVAPWLDRGLTMRLEGDVTSASYITMTIRLLENLGVAVRTSADQRVIRIPGRAAGTGAPRAFDLVIEPDASGATYFWAAAAMVPGASARVEGLGPDSLQGDAEFPELLATMGATVSSSSGPDPWRRVLGPASLSPIIADMADMPDAAMSLAAVASFATGTSILKGLRTLRVKETDRISAMRLELARIGVVVSTPVAGDEGAISISPPPGGVGTSGACPRVEFDTYDDHRMAMSLALIGLRRPNVIINNPGCVAKTYPTFWIDFARLYGGA